MLFNRIKTKNIMVAIIACCTLHGCSNSINERNRLEAERWAKIWEEKPVIVDGEEQIVPLKEREQQNPKEPQNIADVDAEGAAEQDQVRILSAQESRIKRIETKIEALAVQQEGLKSEISGIKENTEKMDNALVQHDANVVIAQQPVDAAGAMGIHLASYKTIENLKIGWQEYLGSGQSIIRDKQARVNNANVSGVDYMRLVVGPYANRNEAKNACAVMKQTVSFCNVVDFKSEILQ